MKEFDYIKKFKYPDSKGHIVSVYVHKINRTVNDVHIVVFLDHLLHTTAHCELLTKGSYKFDYFLYDGKEFEV